MSTRQKTTVNGNGFHVLENQRSTPRETLARRLAAAIGRDHDAIDHISPGVGGKVDVWLVKAADSGYDTIEAPDGWRIVSVGIADTGSPCVSFEQVDQ